MIDPRGPRDWQHDRGAREQPRQSHLRRCRLQLRSHVTDGTVGSADSTRAQREPRDETHFLLFAILQNVLRSAIRHAVTILDAHNLNHRSRISNLTYAYFR